MDNSGWDWLSKIKSGRPWTEKFHIGYWCVCYDIRNNGHLTRMVSRVSKDPGYLSRYLINPHMYLVGPNGKTMSN
jgi:hypothetical protein